PGAAPKKAYPELTNSVPPTMTAPGPSSAPPCAFTPFAVLKSLAVATSQRMWPSSAEYARKCPSSPPEKTTPGMAGHRGRLCWTASGAVSTARMRCLPGNLAGVQLQREKAAANLRSEEHTSELQSRFDLVCRLLL